MTVAVTYLAQEADHSLPISMRTLLF